MIIIKIIIIYFIQITHADDFPSTDSNYYVVTVCCEINMIITSTVRGLIVYLGRN